MPLKRFRIARATWGVAVLLLGMAMALGALIVALRGEARTQVEAEVRADLVAIGVAESNVPVVQTLTMLDRQAGGTLQYVVADADGRRIAGSLRAWPAAPPDARGWTVARDGARRVLGRTLTIDRRFRLFVGRDMTPIDRAADRMLLIGLSLLALVLIASAITAQRSLARTRQRLHRFDAALIGFVEGDEAARIGDRAGDAIGQTARRIDATLATLADALRVNRRLAGTMAHEIIRPVAHAALTVGRATTLGAARVAVQEALETARAAATVLLQRAPPASKPPPPVDLADLVARVAVPLLPADGTLPPIRLRLSAAPARVEPAQTMLLIANLIENALRHAGSGGPVDIATAMIDKRPMLCVADRGSGTAALPRNAQGAPCSGDRHGLDLVRDIAARQGADLSFADRPGGGLRVTCRWPLPLA
ncbi:sensor histidine kinase [Sphingomonas silueang]|uniref:sensor histidine kinase n=1 Tax=Sphingomonas silueang TaxID=3156617 RepID=UPI0032B55651